MEGENLFETRLRRLAFWVGWAALLLAYLAASKYAS